MKTSMLTTLLLITLTVINAATLSVALDGSQAYSSIQAAIEASNSGDTVLVYPGRYLENIDYIGKSITVCSLEASTNDTTYISSTIIDGNQSGSCVAFRNSEQNATLRGFTITNGIGYEIFDGWRRGGGVLMIQVGQINLSNCAIINNKAGIGGGIYSVKSSLSLSGLQIHNNYAVIHGGGITLEGALSHYPNIVFDPVNRCSIFNNLGIGPVDICVSDIRANLEINLDMFTVASPDRFYVARQSNIPVLEQYNDLIDIQRAYRSEVNQDLYVSPSGSDNNSGLSLDQAMKSITKAIHRIAGDSLDVKTVHVMPGTYSEGEDDQILPIPLKSHVNIIGAGSDTTIITSDIPSFTTFKYFFVGNICEDATLKGFSVKTDVESNNHLLFLAKGIKNTHISDVVASDMVVKKHGAVCVIEWESSSIDSLVLRNITTPERAVYMIDAQSSSIRNSIFEDIHSNYSSTDTPGDDSWSGALIGIWVSGSLSVHNCLFRNLSVQNNQPIFGILNYSFANDVDIDISNCLFENIRTNYVIPIAFHNNRFGEYLVSNCTFYDNYGPGGAVGVYGKVAMRNNIFYNPDSPYEIYMHRAVPQQEWIGLLDFDYNSIRGGATGISNSDPRNTVIYGNSNMEFDPMFASTVSGDPYHLRLASNSPCINAGTPDTTGLALPPYDLAGNRRIWDGRIDLGCYEYGSEPWVSNDDPVVPSIPAISLTAYPNPFRAFTNLKVTLPSGQDSGLAAINQARITIYNLKGQKVKTIKLDAGKLGEQITYWDGRDADSVQCSSGIYFINLLINGRTVRSRKVTFIR